MSRHTPAVVRLTNRGYHANGGLSVVVGVAVQEHHQHSTHYQHKTSQQIRGSRYRCHAEVDGLQLLIESLPDGLDVCTGDAPHGVEQDEVRLLLAQVHNGVLHTAPHLIRLVDLNELGAGVRTRVFVWMPAGERNIQNLMQ
ncbi:hypothetical protein E2C01_006692 [Portunus trituberculatus]|uniref:Uncharacterized protein n=1 Tax=Portunus trituberculatus TaxID=210409 RepID=A0A5B7CW21_PORTR|nr:hypothetical protein [Portunus trituberculatus]